MRALIFLVIGLYAGQDHTGPAPVFVPAPLIEGTASWYGPGFDGRRTASGVVFQASALTAAHRTLPFGTIVTVRDVDSGRTVDVTINDRGPYAGNRVLDLSHGAALELGMIDKGVARVAFSVKGSGL